MANTIDNTAKGSIFYLDSITEPEVEVYFESKAGVEQRDFRAELAEEWDGRFRATWGASGTLTGAISDVSVAFDETTRSFDDLKDALLGATFRAVIDDNQFITLSIT